MSDDHWLTDRSRIERGQIDCPRRRYLEYHSGPTSHGIRRKAESLPLATGSHIHDLMCGLVKGEDAEDLIPKTIARYKKRCELRGFLEIPEEDGGGEVQRVVAEQAALIEAFGWAAALEYIPAVLAEHDPVLVEEEILFPLDEGIVLMNRPDAILRKKLDGSLVQWEYKTSGWMHSPAWRRQWEDSRQLLLTKLAVQHKLGEDVSFAYVFGFDKGSRKAEKASGQIKQWSPLLYAYHKPGNPPMEEEDWQLRYSWVDEEGRNRRLGKGYTRQTLHEFPFEGLPEGWSSTRYWVHSLPAEELQTQREILGPFAFLDHVADSVLRGVVANEVEWREKLWRIHEVGEACDWQEDHPDFIQVLDEQVPQSWNCHKFGWDCPYLGICKREPGWEAPLESGRYEPRTPHHLPEFVAARARGIELPEEQEEDPEGE